MTGFLIVNEYLNTNKFKELTELFLQAAKKAGVELIVHTNAEFLVDYESGKANSACLNKGYPDFVIFYDKDISLAIALENMGIPVFNSAAAIEACDSKALTAECVCAYNREYANSCVEGNSCIEETNSFVEGTEAAYQGKGIASDDSFVSEYITSPLTFKLPFTYENIGISEGASFSFLDMIEERISYPMILKESYSSFGMGVHKADSRQEMIELIIKYGNKECIIQEYIDASSRDVRLQMVGDTLVAAMMRSNDADFRSNLTNGGMMSNYEPTKEDLALARAVMRCLSLDFAGIDIMHDKSGRAIFCEANSNAHFKNLYDLTGINAAEYMIQYIKECIG